jgi:Ca2+-binding RTX toxin-like protein
MSGGEGWDTFHVDDANDRVEDVDDNASEHGGSGEVHTSVSVYWGRGHGFFSVRETTISDLYLIGDSNLFAAGNRLRNTIYGNSGDNGLSGVGGNDLLHGRAGADHLVGGDGADTLRGGPGNDGLHGETGSDSLTGGAGDDNLHGFTESDVLEGGDGNDYLDGGGGGDLLVGGAGADILTGGDSEGADTLVGGEGADQLGGGGGADVFVFAAADSTPTAPDIIFDFNFHGGGPGDRIDVSAIDADTTTAGDQAFVFGTETSKGHLWQLGVGCETWIQGNVDDDPQAELEVVIDQSDGCVTIDYGAGDFVL